MWAIARNRGNTCVSVLSARIHCIPGYPESILPLSKIPFFSIILEIAIMPTTQNATTRKTAPRTTTRRQKQDAITLLTEDHDKVKKMFKDYDKLCKKDDTEGKEALSGQICRALTVHSQLEEEIFYPVVRKAIDDDTLMNEAIIEHTTAKDLIAQIQSMRVSDPMYDAAVTVLGEYINHHVQEEQNEIFPKARKAKIDLEELGIEMAERKKVLMEE
jgi:hemerythrin-like domain-containing protein